MTTVQTSPPPGATPFAIYEDQEDLGPPSPSEVFEEDLSFSSELSLPTADDAMPSVEEEGGFEGEPRPYRSSFTSRKSSLKPRRSSGHYSFISAIPSESSIASKPAQPIDEDSSASYSPRKDRPRFRNPESVRAMQMSSPPPMASYEGSRERTRGTYKLATPIRDGRSATPVSRKSASHRDSFREHQSPRPMTAPQQAPLVLLHVTILPMQVPFSHDLMLKVMPEWLVENYKLLEEKLQDIILMRRGLLIPHPRDEYELLEERILESLELKIPRLLKCGHFVPPEDDTDREDEDDVVSVSDDTGRGSRMSGGTLTDESKWGEHIDHGHGSMCADCNRELKRPGKGLGAGSRKWDIKIYAANGLMRAPAWSACWNDMERCDVEISPWIPNEVRKMLERRVNEEMEAEKRKKMYAVELQRQIQEAAIKSKLLEEDAAQKKQDQEKRTEELELQKSFDAAVAALQKSVEEKAAEKRKFEELLEEKLEEAKESVRLELGSQALAESSATAERLRLLEEHLKQKESAALAQQNAESKVTARPKRIPLGTLLKNYARIQLGDSKNFIILLLGALVVYLAMNMDPALKQPLLSARLPEAQVPEVQSELVMQDSASVLTSYSTLTVTEIHTTKLPAQSEIPVEATEVTISLTEEASVALEEEVVVEAEPAAMVAEDDITPSDPVTSVNEEETVLGKSMPLVAEEEESIIVAKTYVELSKEESPEAGMCIVEHVLRASIDLCPTT